MAYDEVLAERALQALAAHPGVKADAVEERRMFGGVTYMVAGSMVVGVLKEVLVVRTTPEEAEGFLKEPGVRPMDFTGKPMKGWLYVDGAAVEDEASMARWIDRAVKFSAVRAPKVKAKAKKKR